MGGQGRVSSASIQAAIQSGIAGACRLWPIALMSRSGAKCQIDRFSELVAERPE